MSSLKILLAATAIAAFAAPAAFAQSAPPSDGAPQHHAWQKPSPEQMAAWHTQMCKSHYARVAGKLAYLQADLSITEAQRGPFDQWKDVVLSSAKAHSDACLARAPMMADGQKHHHDALERNARMQKMLESKLAELKSERPALESLYASLTPDQKALFDRAEAHHDHHGHDHGMGHGGERFGHNGGWQQKAG